MESWRMASDPIGSSIGQLKQRHGGNIDKVTGPRKVMQFYRLHGGLGALQTSAAHTATNWALIVRHICPDVSDKNISDFILHLELGHFCMDPKADAVEHMKTLRQELIDGLAGDKRMDGLRKKRAKAEVKVRKAKRKLKSAEEALDEAIEDGLKSELPDLRDDKKEASTALKDAQAEEMEAVADLEEKVLDDFDVLFVMLLQVSKGVGNVYQSVLLANGMDACAWTLQQLFGLFATPIRAYCEQAALVYESSMSNMSIVQPEVSKAMVLDAVPTMPAPTELSKAALMLQDLEK